MDPVVYTLIAFWALALLVCAGWCVSCCLCGGMCCPRRLQRVLGVLAIVLFVATVLATAIAAHRLDALVRGTERTMLATLSAARFARKSIELLETL